MGRESCLRAWMAAISSSEKPTSAREADHVGGSPTKLSGDALAELTEGNSGDVRFVDMHVVLQSAE